MSSPNPSQFPSVNHNVSYTKYERLVFAISHYFAELKLHEAAQLPKPSVLKISKMYDVTEPTLRRHIKTPGQRTAAQHHAAMQLLTVEEEKVLVERLLFLDDFNVPASKITFYELAHNLLHRRLPGRQIGRDWIYRFLDRHPECRYVLTKTIAANRANAVNWDIMDDFFWKLKQTRIKYSIALRDTYNLDEKGFVLGIGEVTKRICRNIRQNPQYKESRNRESCTVVESMSADGFVLTPLIIFKGANHLAGWHRDVKEEEYWYGYGPKGYNNSQLCLEYIQKIFDPQTAARAFGEWRMLIFDGFDSHIDVDLIEYCLDHKIIPFCLPAHTSHVLQPLDVGVFSPLKKYYTQEVSKLRIPVDKNNFPNLLARARRKAFTTRNIQSAFRATGIWPYDPLVILQNLVLPEPSLPALEPSPPKPLHLESPYDLLTYRPKTPTTPRSIHNLYVEGLGTITSNSPRSVKQRAVFTKLKMSAEKSAARAVMHEAGEAYLREEIKKRESQVKADTRRINSDSACVLERGTVLAELKRKRDETEAQKASKKRKNASS